MPAIKQNHRWAIVVDAKLAVYQIRGLGRLGWARLLTYRRLEGFAPRVMIILSLICGGHCEYCHKIYMESLLMHAYLRLHLCGFFGFIVELMSEVLL